MKSRYVSLRKNPADSPENKNIRYPGKRTRFGKHLFITCLKIEYALCLSSCSKFLQLFFLNSNAITKPNSLFSYKKKENELDPPRSVIYSTESNDTTLLHCRG